MQTDSVHIPLVQLVADCHCTWDSCVDHQTLRWLGK